MHNKRLLIISGLLYTVGALLPYASFATSNDYIQSIMDQKQIEVIQGDSWETQYPTWAKPDPSYEKTDLAYRVHEVLPYKSDRNSKAYIVYPKVGIVAPVKVISEADKQSILARKGFNHFPYLELGVLHYVGYSPVQGVGNMVIAGHSAYFNNDPGRYKTAFQAVILSDRGDRIWYFEQQEDGSYTRYEYQITDSQETQTSDVSILFPTKDIKQLTTYTCYPIGTSKDRWYNKADLIGELGGFSAALTTPTELLVEDEVQEPTQVAVVSEQDQEAQEIHEAAPTDNAPKIIRKTRQVYEVSQNAKEEEMIPQAMIYNAVTIATAVATHTYYTSF
ncbi:MAG: sortase [Candidatus Absconditabacterales bacterium]